MDSLPDEIIALIFGNISLNLVDILAIAHVSRRFRVIIRNATFHFRAWVNINERRGWKTLETVLHGGLFPNVTSITVDIDYSKPLQFVPNMTDLRIPANVTTIVVNCNRVGWMLYDKNMSITWDAAAPLLIWNDRGMGMQFDNAFIKAMRGGRFEGAVIMSDVKRIRENIAIARGKVVLDNYNTLFIDYVVRDLHRHIMSCMGRCDVIEIQFIDRDSYDSDYEYKFTIERIRPNVYEIIAELRKCAPLDKYEWTMGYDNITMHFGSDSRMVI